MNKIVDGDNLDYDELNEGTVELSVVDKKITSKQKP